MKEIIVDTSVWIDFFNNKESRESLYLTSLIERDELVCITPTIVQEILQGFRSDKIYEKCKEILLAFRILTLDPVESAIGAAHLYRAVRKQGATIRKSNDCLIAYFAIEFDIPLLHKDRDFKQISSKTDLKIVDDLE